jgi:Na+/phosphate symporter
MESKHTKGPWKVISYTGHPFTYKINVGQNELSELESESNAKLIAAAPDLLISLKKAEDYITRSLTLSEKLSEKEIELIIGHARLAIKKATE